MRVADHNNFEDFRSDLAMTEHHCTAEPFLKLNARHDDQNATITELGLLLVLGEFFLPPEFDLRIQRIGEKVRVFRRFSMAGNWKTNCSTRRSFQSTYLVRGNHRNERHPKERS